MKITKYKRGGDPRHIIEYKHAPGNVSTGKLGTDEDAPGGLDQVWRDLRTECGNAYGQNGMVIREIRWSYYKEHGEENILIIGDVPHWSGEMRVQLPKFAIRVVNAYDEIQQQFFTRRDYPKELEAVAQAVDRLQKALAEFVREGTSQMELGFGVQETTEEPSMRVVKQSFQ